MRPSDINYLQDLQASITLLYQRVIVARPQNCPIGAKNFHGRVVYYSREAEQALNKWLAERKGTGCGTFRPLKKAQHDVLFRNS